MHRVIWTVSLNLIIFFSLYVGFWQIYAELFDVRNRSHCSPPIHSWNKTSKQPLRELSRNCWRRPSNVRWRSLWLHLNRSLKRFVCGTLVRYTSEFLDTLVRCTSKFLVKSCSISILFAVCSSLVTSCFLKDFALDPDETRMRTAAHHLVRFMTAGMMLITCHEPLLVSINNQLKTVFLTALRVS